MNAPFLKRHADRGQAKVARHNRQYALPIRRATYRRIAVPVRLRFLSVRTMRSPIGPRLPQDQGRGEGAR